jgi:hypothetical protein
MLYSESYRSQYKEVDMFSSESNLECEETYILVDESDFIELVVASKIAREMSRYIYAKLKTAVLLDVILSHIRHCAQHEMDLNRLEINELLVSARIARERGYNHQSDVLLKVANYYAGRAGFFIVKDKFIQEVGKCRLI